MSETLLAIGTLGYFEEQKTISEHINKELVSRGLRVSNIDFKPNPFIEDAVGRYGGYMFLIRKGDKACEVFIENVNLTGETGTIKRWLDCFTYKLDRINWNIDLPK
jgi:hypothetical protein